MSHQHDYLTQSECEWLLDAAERDRLTRDHATSIELVARKLDGDGNALAAAVMRALAKKSGMLR